MREGFARNGGRRVLESRILGTDDSHSGITKRYCRLGYRYLKQSKSKSMYVKNKGLREAGEQLQAASEKKTGRVWSKMLQKHLIR